MKKETDKYLLPVEVIKHQPYKWFKIKTYEYKLYADASEKKFTHIKFIDINGFIIGEHMPTKLNTIYDKAAAQIKNNTVKVVSEIRQVVDEVTDATVNTVNDMKQDVSKTALQTASIAVGLFGKIKSYAQDKMRKNNDDTNITVVNTEVSDSSKKDTNSN